ncbi:glycoside hydrolase family 65 protein [Companilactobacillus paralimentarius]|uniref:glycoside hydrolase family 65 protein n=1 Tax=Companilactobacillus paralimentarius TaxID=83526 RepID=UPI00384B0A98
MSQLSKILELDDLKSTQPAYLESIFSLANGHVGVRASNPINPSEDAGTIVNGFYEKSNIHYGEKAYGYAEKNQTIVKLPDIRRINIYDEDKNRFDRSQLKDMHLDMAQGILFSTYELSNSQNESIRLKLTSVTGQKRNQFIGLHYEIVGESYVGNIKIEKNFGLDTTIQDSDDPRKSRNINTLQYDVLNLKDLKSLRVTTDNSKLFVEMGLSVNKDIGMLKTLRNGSVKFDVVAVVGNINQHISSTDLPNFESIKNESTNFWTQFWNQSEIKINGDDSLDQAIHFNLYQLESSAGRDGKTNISAKGLSGVGYEGHYFWDTEMYMAPFFTFTNPDVAVNLIKYRYSILPEAKERARTLGVNDGALFAWRTINGKEASAYYPASTAQYHINADIAYAIYRYFKITKDKQLIRDCGLEIVLETAKFWSNFGSFSEINGKQQFCFFDVTGPDEYSAIVNNNYYTNRMAKFNLDFSIELIKRFPETAKQLGVNSDDLKKFTRIRDAIYLPFDEKKGINEQDDSYFRKPVWPFATTPKENYPLLLHYHPLTLYRYQVNKQADTLFADFLFDDISKKQLMKEYNYYEKITTHDSSLSRSIFSALAARLGLKDKAYSYFLDTAKTDLIDLQGNTKDGLHIANLGGSWVTIVEGFGGIQVKNNMLYIQNNLPKKWNGMTIRIKYNGSLLNIEYAQNNIHVEMLSGSPINMVINGIKSTIK